MPDCTRSHPHDDPCRDHDLLTRITRLENALRQIERLPESCYDELNGIGAARSIAHTALKPITAHNGEP